MHITPFAVITFRWKHHGDDPRRFAEIVWSAEEAAAFIAADEPLRIITAINEIGRSMAQHFLPPEQIEAL